MSNLLDQYSLISVDVTRVLAELHRAVPASEQCQARIELKLSPQAPIGDLAKLGGHVLHARLSVIGLPGSGHEEQKLFSLEVAVNALYRPVLDRFGQTVGDTSFEHFNRAHTHLTRQIFPILERRAQQLLSELGLFHIRLPLDLLPEPDTAVADAPMAYH